MDLSGIITIAGYSGLYKVVAQSKNGVIVESLIDKKRMPAYSHYRISALEEISIFGVSEDIPLKDVMQKIMDKEKSGPAIDSKADIKELKKYFEAVLPEYDKDRVHDSDIKKVISWYNLLQKNDLLKVVEEDKNNEDSAEEKALKALKAKEKTALPSAKTMNTSANVKSSGSKAKSTSTIRKTGA
jgi:Domain of unknown function (DUF5606)